MKLQTIFRLKGFLLVVLLSSMSCTVLQWRSSDKEIFQNFETLGIPTKISYFDVDSLDLKIRVQEVTHGDNEVNLLFFHGSPSSLSAWNGYLKNKTLFQKVNLFAVDRPGYGYSNFGDEMTSIQMQASIMSDLIDAYDLSNVIVVGSSYGGPLVARMAVLNQRIKAVVMISSAIDPTKEKQVWGSRLTQWWLTRWLVPTGYRVAGDEKTTHAMELALLEKDWGLVRVPVIHIHGDEDRIVPYENVQFTAKKFSEPKIITTAHTGHEIAWGRPDLIIPHLLELIDELLVNLSK